jgi:2'-hydroxyisoflavone reductase
MRMLIFGGTVFVGRAIAAEAVGRGHDVVCATRGRSGPLPDGAQLLRVDRDAPDALEPLAGEQFDAVVDTSIMSYRWVADALRVLADQAGHWTFVSSISVYADTVTPGQRPGAPVLEPRPVHATLADRAGDPELYGAVKVASENAVLEAFGERAFVVRPGLISGAGDHTDRFGYWPMRFARGGRVLVPDDPQLLTQYIDVQDLAAWVVDASEQRLGGVFDGIGPAAPLSEVLPGIAEAVGFEGELVRATPEQLTAAGVNVWAGPRSLPLWLGPDLYGMTSHDAQPALDAGLRVRTLAEAAAAALEHERLLGVDRPRSSGLTPAEEAEVLAEL